MRLRKALGLLAIVVLSAASAGAATKVACVGDSITFGSGISDPAQRYPAVLQTLLGSAYEVRNFGVSGRTLMRAGDRPYWDTTQFTDSTNYQPAVVVIMLGTNDAKDINWGFKSTFEGDYRDLVAHYRGLASHPKVFVARPCPMFSPASATWRANVVEMVSYVDRVITSNAAEWIDVNFALGAVSLFQADGVHPNAAGANVVAQTVRTALTRTEITPGGSHVSASTQDSNVPANSVDGSLSTRWSGSGDGASIQYDLGFARPVGHVRIGMYLGNARRYSFDLQTSTCCGAWATVWTGQSSGLTTAEETYDFADVSARYVRLVGHGNTVNTWNGVTELSIFPATGTTPTPTLTPTPTPASPTPTPTPTPSSTNLALGRPASASSTWSSSYDAAKAVDGTTTTRWSAASGLTTNQWLAVDLGAGATYARVVVKEISYPRVTSYTLQSSSDGATYTDIAGTAGTTLGAAKTITFVPVNARYVRLHVNTASGVPTINELEAYSN